jgi:hypothetical protein
MASPPVIFLDIDGVLLPARAYVMRTQARRLPPFDPIGVSMVTRLCEETGAKLVISSTWRKRRPRAEMCVVLLENGFEAPGALMHEDWATPVLDSQPRGQQIAAWLRNHPTVETYVALDDDPSIAGLSGAVLCPSDDGIGLEQYNRARELLGLQRVVALL